MNNQLSYKSYSGSCEVSIEDECLHGRILFITDLITYEGNTITELKESFKTAVDNYITYCAKTGKPANKPYSGSFNVRISPELHKAAAQRAKRAGITLNEYVRLAIEREINHAEQINVSPNEITVNHKITIAHAEKSLDIPFEIPAKDSQWKLDKLKLN